MVLAQGSYPVLIQQTLHPLELPEVAAHQRVPLAAGVGGDGQIVGADRCYLALQGAGGVSELFSVPCRNAARVGEEVELSFHSCCQPTDHLQRPVWAEPIQVEVGRDLVADLVAILFGFLESSEQLCDFFDVLGAQLFSLVEDQDVGADSRFVDPIAGQGHARLHQLVSATLHRKQTGAELRAENS